VTARSTDPVAYLVFPALIWAALRFNARGATAALLVAVTLAVWATTHYEGPFSFESIGDNVRDLQVFIAIVAVLSLCLAAPVAERGLYAQRFGESQAQLFDVAERERPRIERNIHDGAQQRLLALGLRLRLAAGAGGALGSVGIGRVHRRGSRARCGGGRTARALAGTHPSLLEELSLADAIRSVAARSSIPVTIPSLPETGSGDVAEETAYSVVLEGIANAIKHSHATAIHVHVASYDGVFRITVRDDGIGSADEDVGTGLKGLRERVEAADGTFELSSPPRVGTSTAAVVPTR